MKSGTSFFNGAALRKDITRFAPVWGLYSVFLLLLLISMQSGGTWSFRNSMIEEINMGFSFMNVYYGGICAAMLFGDLFNGRMCNMLHSFPMRREGWFLTHVTAGLLFSFVPNLLFTCAAMLLLGSGYYIALLWLAIMTLTFLFYFGVGCISAMCAGNRFAMLTVYGIINLFSMLVYLLVSTIYSPLFYGFTIPSDALQFLCPAIQLGGAEYLKISDKLVYGAYRTQVDGVVWGTWYYTFVIAGVGLVFMGLALWAYRRRALERAGDFIAIRPLAPVFLVIYTLSVGALMFSLAELTENSFQYIFLAIGLLVGYFTGRMLLERTVKVFRPKVLLGFVLLVAMLFVSLGVVRLDPLRVIRYVPNAEEVESIEITTSGMNTPHTGGDRAWIPVSGEYLLTEREDIETILALHKTILKDRPQKDDYETFTLCLTYRLKDGSTVQRRYPVERYNETGRTLQGYFSDWRYVFQTNADWDTFVSRIKGYSYDSYCFQPDLTDVKIPELMEAIRLDCENGSFAQDWCFHQYEDTLFRVTIAYTTDSGKGAEADLYVFTGCTNLLKFIKEMYP